MDPGSHVGFQISTKNTSLVEDHLQKGYSKEIQVSFDNNICIGVFLQF
jgi:hypothetical protein